MSPADRLLAEQWPDGTFGGARPAPEPRTRQERLLAALDGWHYHRDRRNTRTAA